MPPSQHIVRSIRRTISEIKPNGSIFVRISRSKIAWRNYFRRHYAGAHPSHLSIRNGSKRVTDTASLEAPAQTTAVPTDAVEESEDVQYSYSSFLKAMLRYSHSQERAIFGTPLELEILRGQNFHAFGHLAARMQHDTLESDSTQVSIPAAESMQAQNLGMLDYYDDATPPSASARADSGSTGSSSESVFGNGGTTENLADHDPLENARSMIQINATLLDVGLRNPRISRQLAFDLYRRLPHPGVLHLKARTRHRLLGKLSRVGVNEKDERAMMQYLSVFDDLHSAGITPRLPQWAAAMHLSGRCFKKVTISELESAMRIWKRMEEDAGIRSNTQTMNILLDIAMKAGQLEIAELTLAEMRRRNLRFDRVTRLGEIYLKGLRGDGNGVRSAYRDFVLAKEVVDTMTLTCVLSALLKAGELSAAMNLYQRMLSRGFAMRGTHMNSPKDVWEMGRLLTKFTPAHAHGSTVMAQIQGDVTVRPNIITYINLIGYHANHTGEMVAIASLLDDMHTAGVPMHGSVFTELFRGFSQHGNKIFTSWTKDRLEEVWKAFKWLADSGNKDIFVGPVTATAVLEAFRDCYGRHRALQILAEMRSLWRKLDESHEFNEWWLKSTTGLLTDRSIRHRPQIGQLLK